jgi:low affinity Fe/Cu permease|tara:strand:- start:186 stop:323 length:138 start_codon:yes stop_codon:yes gene_type:complete
MIKTILIIIVSVAIFGLIVFVLVRNALRRKIDQLVEEEKKSNNLD